MRKVILFGAGMYGGRFIEKNSVFINKSFLFCDNNLDKQGKIIFGLSVISFCEMKMIYERGEIERIIITTERVGDIFGQCIQNGISDRDIYFYDINSNSIKLGLEMQSSVIYSQDGEETFLKDFFRDKTNGFYVDVGAYDPFRFSNTAWAYKRGWSGINIEPHTKGYEKFIWARRRDINLNCGVLDKEEILPYFEYEEGAYNSFCKEETSENIVLNRINKIRTRRLDSIFDEYNVGHIDFLDIDVEGMELNVLASNDWGLYRPTIILCEQRIDMVDVIKSDIYSYMKQNGYEAISKYSRTVIYKEVSSGK